MTDHSRPPLTFAYFPQVPSFSLVSLDVRDNEMLTDTQVANVMGYNGANRSPQLSWGDFPNATKSFALTMHDPDAPTGSGFWHWVVINIPAETTELASGAASGALPSGALTIVNDAGLRGYLGAAPPPGDVPHRYVHTVHAVDVERLEVAQDASPAIVGFNLRFHGIARAQIVPIFGS